MKRKVDENQATASYWARLMHLSVKLPRANQNSLNRKRRFAGASRNRISVISHLNSNQFVAFYLGRIRLLLGIMNRIMREVACQRKRAKNWKLRTLTMLFHLELILLCI